MLLNAFQIQIDKLTGDHKIYCFYNVAANSNSNVGTALIANDVFEIVPLPDGCAGVLDLKTGNIRGHQNSPDTRHAKVDERRRTCARKCSESVDRNEVPGRSHGLHETHLAPPVLRIFEKFDNMPARFFAEITLAQASVQDVVPIG